MPSLFRFLILILVLFAVGYGVMIALVSFLHPSPHEITQSVPLPKPQK